MAKKLTSKQLLKKAEEYNCHPSAPTGLSHAFMAIYSLQYGLQGATLKKRARQAQISFTQKNDLDDYTKRYGKWRVLIENKSSDTLKYLQDFVVGYEERSALHSGRVLREDSENNELVVQKDGRRKGLADQVIGYVQGVPLSKRYKAMVKRTKTEYKSFIGDIALEIYCEGEDLDFMDTKNTPFSNQTLMFDLLTVRTLSSQIASKLEEKFREQGHLTRRGKIFNKASERIIREEVETYFNDILFDYLEERRKNSKLNFRARKKSKSKSKKELNFSHLKDEDIVGEVDRIDDDETYRPPRYSAFGNNGDGDEDDEDE